MTEYRWFMAAIVMTCGVFAVGLAQSAVQPPWGGGKPNDVVDQFQKSYDILNHSEVAKSGAQRGETIYFYTCWMCHNQLSSSGGDTSGVVGPLLEGVSKRLTDQALAAKIKDGGPGMPSFKTDLTDADVADLVAYLKTPTCCYQLQDPPKNPRYNADKVQWPVQSALKGGTRGTVRAADGRRLEGIKVQLIAPNHVRTTVFTNDQGAYEFPAMKAGSYTLRIATPLPWKAYIRENVSVTGTNALDDIVLEPLPTPQGSGWQFVGDSFPATPEVMSQLSGSEWLWNMPGTMQEKVNFSRSCQTGCHSYESMLWHRFDQRGWRLVLERHRTAVTMNVPGRKLDQASTTAADIDELAKWLTKVRGPESALDPVRPWPQRPSGAATRVVITEYESNRRLQNMHDVCGPDSKGNIWYMSWHAPYVGYLDPRTGIITDYKFPAMSDGRINTGFGACRVDNKRGYVWVTQGTAQPLPREIFRLNMATGKIDQFPAVIENNIGLAPDGFLWREWPNASGQMEIRRVDPESVKIVNSYPRSFGSSFQTAVSNDGRFVAGGSMVGPGGKYAWMLDVKNGKVYELLADDHHLHGAARGGFDPFGNAWFGGHWGPLVELVNEIDKGNGIQMRLFWPPTPAFPFTDFYAAMPDKNGEVWGGLLHGKEWVRYNPKTDHWTVYENPEPSSNSRFELIDNSTTPVTLWYVDFQTQTFIRIQPME
jgi:streptogramin lyase/mono/diheme cytochrome c family protein